MRNWVRGETGDKLRRRKVGSWGDRRTQVVSREGGEEEVREDMGRRGGR